MMFFHGRREVARRTAAMPAAGIVDRVNAQLRVKA
jgi:hypothetical protein